MASKPPTWPSPCEGERLGGGEHLRELRGPIERIDPVALLVVQQAQLLPIVKFRPDERVAALDVARQVGQGALLEQAELAAQGLLALAFQHLQQQRQLGHFHGLRVDVHAVDVRRQDALPLGRGQPPLAARGLVDRQRAVGLPRPLPGRSALFRQQGAHFARCGRVTGLQQRRQVGHVLFKIPVQQVLVDLQQEGAGPAGDVGDAQGRGDPAPAGHLTHCFAGQQRAHGAPDDDPHDESRRVKHAAGLLHLRLRFDNGAVPGS